MDNVEDDLALVDLDLEVLQRAALRIATPDLEMRLVAHLLLLEQRRELRRHRREGLVVESDLSVLLAQHDVDLPPFGIGERVVVAGVPTPALLAFERGHRDALGYPQHVVQVNGQMPTGVEPAVAGHRKPGRTLLKRLDLLERALELLGRSNDPDQVVHHLLQVLMHRVRVLRALGLERRQRRLAGPGDLLLGYDRPTAAQTGRVLRRVLTGPPAEYQQVG